MKKTLLILSLLMLGACASQKVNLPEEKGTLCIKPPPGETLAKCYPQRLYLDPLRFHGLRPWQQKALGDMPDLP